MVTVADLPAGNPVVVKAQLEQQGRQALRTLIELSRAAGGDATGADKSRPYSTTRYIRAMDELTDLAQERPEMRKRILPSILQMQRDAPQDSRLYTLSRLKLQRLVWESAQAQSDKLHADRLADLEFARQGY